MHFARRVFVKREENVAVENRCGRSNEVHVCILVVIIFLLFFCFLSLQRKDIYIKKVPNTRKKTMATDAPKVALITGITGQDGSYLAELLLEKGYTVSILRVSHLPTAIGE
jgi:hypothetical protein